MATYKVLQDIEAEDKFLGPLTLKQFIFASIATIGIYVSFLTVSRGTWLVTLVLFPFVLVFGFLAWPWGRDQPTEIWLAAKIRFLFKPRKRIWDQTGIQELVEITAPKKNDHQFTNYISQTEVKSRLHALADTLDSRGWAVKNVNINLFATPAYATGSDSDRLIDPSTLPQDVPTYDIQAADDILDPQASPVAQQLNSMIQTSSQNHRTAVVQKMKQGAQPGHSAAEPPNDYWFMAQDPAPPTGTAAFQSQTLRPGTDYAENDIEVSPEEAALLARAKIESDKPKAAFGHMRVLSPTGGQKTENRKQKTDGRQQASPQTTDPAILGLANNDDLNVATIAREANKTMAKNSGDDEVVIPLR